MTTEDDFQAAIDAHPEDWQTRLVFADWLDEHGDPRAAGYRALARGGFRPIAYAPYCAWWREGIGQKRRHDDLPNDWFTLLATASENFKKYRTRREADDSAALAFAKLPAKRRAKLLQPA